MSGPWLRNMSSPPRTTVVCDQSSVNGCAVAFSISGLLQRAGQRLPAAVKTRIRAVGLKGLDSNDLTAALRHISPAAQLDVEREGERPPLRGVLVGWRNLGGGEPAPSTLQLSGDIDFKDLLFCTDVGLVLAILSRCESQLYLGHRQPRGDLRQLADHPVIFDDPRLCALPDLAPKPKEPWPQTQKEAEERARVAAKRKKATARRKARKTTPRASRRRIRNDGA